MGFRHALAMDERRPAKTPLDVSNLLKHVEHDVVHAQAHQRPSPRLQHKAVEHDHHP